MSTATNFSDFIDNLAIPIKTQISERYGRITKALNKKFRETESDTANTLQIGSYGRHTAIKGVSDLDMVYVMPTKDWNAYNVEGGQRKLLNEVSSAISSTYSTTHIKVDGQVVVVTFANYEIEVLPSFTGKDDSFIYPDCNDGGRWRKTKPKQEIEEFADLNNKTSSSLRNLSKMVRSWRNHVGYQMGGLLIDTLAYNFMKSHEEYQAGGFSMYDLMLQSFFVHISELPKEQKIYKAPGSHQNVYVKKAFTSRAKKATRHCAEAIAAKDQANENKKWKKIFGRPFPAKQTLIKEASEYTFRDTEEFIEDLYPVDITYTIQLDCDVSQNGFRGNSLRSMIRNCVPLLAKKKLSFKVTCTNIPMPFELKWKVLNQGDEAERRDCIRGQVVTDRGQLRKEEPTKFKGNHLVECYAIVNGVCVARNSVKVPISTNSN